MSFPLYIAKRYIFSRSKNNAINVINRIATLGIIIGTMSLFVVLSVFSGLKVFSLSFSNEMDPDLKISSTFGKTIDVSTHQENKIKAIEGVISYSKIIEERVLFTYNGKQEVTYLKGVDSIYNNLTSINKNLYDGQWLKPNTYQAVVGYGIANKFSLGLLDFNSVFEVLVPKSGKGTIENPEEAFNQAVLIPVGIYAINEDLDSKYVFVGLGLAQELLEYNAQQVSGIELKIKSNTNETEVKKKLESIFDKKIKVKNRAQLNESLYKMLNTENLAVYLIFTLVNILALFNWFGALIMMILDKKENLKTLFNLGTQIKDLRKIFLLQGTLLSFFGAIIGLILGSIVVLLQQYFELIMITPSLAYPVIFSIENLAIVLATIISLGFIASLIASRSVTKKFLE